MNNDNIEIIVRYLAVINASRLFFLAFIYGHPVVFSIYSTKPKPPFTSSPSPTIEGKI